MIDRFKPIAVALLLAAAPASAETVSELERAELWNDCKPVRLLIESLSDYAADIGLAREAIEVAVRSQLRSARLYTASKDVANPTLYVRVNVVGRAYAIGIYYRKLLLDPITNLPVLAFTWDSGSAGQHGADSNFILQNVAQYVDKFIDEYLRVNNDACGPLSATDDR